MSEKRKDKKGRVFRSGEGQRPNKTYFYRYHRNGETKWYYVYAPTLEELRQKEEVIQRDLLDGIDYAGGEITVAELVDRYINLRRGLKENSMRAYGSAINRIHTDPFGCRMIRSVRLSDGKGWFVSLHDKGLKQNTIGILQSVLRPAFEMAVDDDMIRKNPFKFKLSDVIPNDAYVRSALTKAQQERYLQFIRDHGKDNYYDDIVILLGTGLRVSELYGLTKADIDFDRRCIHIHIFLQAVGKALASTLLSMFREVVFGVGFALLLPVFFGLDGVLYSMPVSDILTFIISAVLTVKTYRELYVEREQDI